MDEDNNNDINIPNDGNNDDNNENNDDLTDIDIDVDDDDDVNDFNDGLIDYLNDAKFDDNDDDDTDDNDDDNNDAYDDINMLFNQRLQEIGRRANDENEMDVALHQMWRRMFRPRNLQNEFRDELSQFNVQSRNKLMNLCENALNIILKPIKLIWFDPLHLDHELNEYNYILNPNYNTNTNNDGNGDCLSFKFKKPNINFINVSFESCHPITYQYNDEIYPLKLEHWRMNLLSICHVTKLIFIAASKYVYVYKLSICNPNDLLNPIKIINLESVINRLQHGIIFNQPVVYGVTMDGYIYVIYCKNLEKLPRKHSNHFSSWDDNSTWSIGAGPDGWVCVGSNAHMVHVYNFEDMDTYDRIPLHGHNNNVPCVGYHPNNIHKCASCSIDGTLKIWEYTDHDLPHPPITIDLKPLMSDSRNKWMWSLSWIDQFNDIQYDNDIINNSKKIMNVLFNYLHKNYAFLKGNDGLKKIMRDIRDNYCITENKDRYMEWSKQVTHIIDMVVIMFNDIKSSSDQYNESLFQETLQKLDKIKEEINAFCTQYNNDYQAIIDKNKEEKAQENNNNNDNNDNKETTKDDNVDDNTGIVNDEGSVDMEGQNDENGTDDDDANEENIAQASNVNDMKVEIMEGNVNNEMNISDHGDSNENEMDEPDHRVMHGITPPPNGNDVINVDVSNHEQKDVSMINSDFNNDNSEDKPLKKQKMNVDLESNEFDFDTMIPVIYYDYNDNNELETEIDLIYLEENKMSSISANNNENVSLKEELKSDSKCNDHDNINYANILCMSDKELINIIGNKTEITNLSRIDLEFEAMNQIVCYSYTINIMVTIKL